MLEYDQLNQQVADFVLTDVYNSHPVGRSLSAPKCPTSGFVGQQVTEGSDALGRRESPFTQK